MKKILIIFLLLLLSLTAFSQIPFKIHNKDIRFKWGSDSMRFDITGKGFYLRDTIYFADGTKQWSADTIGGVAGNWSMSGLKIYPTTPNAYVNTDSSYYIKGIDLIRYDKDSFNLSIGYEAGTYAPTYHGSLNNNIGLLSGFNARSTRCNYFGTNSGETNDGNSCIGIGNYSLTGNDGDSVISIGTWAGVWGYSGVWGSTAYNTLDNWLYIGRGDTNESVINGYIGNTGTKRLRLNANVAISGNLSYNMVHGVASTDSIAWSTGTTSGVYYKLNPTGADTLKEHEADGVFFNGDSILIATAGHYKIMCWLNLSTSGASDKIRVKLYKNNAPFPLNTVGRWIINSDGSGSECETKNYMWYADLAVNDVLSVRVTNLTGNRAVVLRDWKIYIEKIPE